MSTKAIRKVLRDMQCDYNPCLTGMCRKHEALSEVEAIERAAKTMDAWNRDGQRKLDPEMARAWSLMESIAKDAP